MTSSIMYTETTLICERCEHEYVYAADNHYVDAYEKFVDEYVAHLKDCYNMKSEALKRGIR